MGDDPATSVVNADCRVWDIPNLWVCDGSVFPTVGGVNPSLTIQAIACRTADRIKAMAHAESWNVFGAARANRLSDNAGGSTRLCPPVWRRRPRSQPAKNNAAPVSRPGGRPPPTLAPPTQQRVHGRSGAERTPGTMQSPVTG